MIQSFCRLSKLAFALSLSLIAIACSSNEYKSTSKPKPKVIDQDDPERDFGMQARANLSASQLFMMMQTMTGVAPTVRPEQGSNTLQEYFDTQRASMPIFNQAKTLSTSHFNAIANLSERFCKALSNVEAERTRFFQGTDFETLDSQDTVANIFGSASQKREWANFFLVRFWPQAEAGLISLNPYSDELVDQISDIIQVAEIGASPDNTNTVKVMTHLCTAVLSSAPLVLQ